MKKNIYISVQENDGNKKSHMKEIKKFFLKNRKNKQKQNKKNETHTDT